MSESSDDEPTLAHLYGSQRAAAAAAAQNSDDSEMPDWMETHTPTQPAIDISSDHDGSDLQAGPSRTAAGGAGSSKAAAAGSKPGSSSQQAAAAAASNSQAAGKAGSSAAAAAAAAAGGIAVAASIDRSELQLILPEKLVRHKVLVELEPAPHQATELSGDAGAVGRLVASSSTAEDGQFKLDLKGVIYQATVLPLAGTAMVVNLGPTEAKVESVLNDFVRLREECSYHDSGTALEGGYGMAELMADDEDVYQLGEEGKEGDKAAAKKAAAKRAGQAGGSKAAAAGSRALKPAKAGVKKKPAKPKSASKGGGKAAGGSKARSTPKKAASKPKSAAKPKAAPKAKPASAAKTQKKKKQDSDEEDDWDDSGYSD
uniref:Uncharacterized protein n=1 Tax=Tetradesmus obliquus TaxID=3088 RepID=A0A383W5Z5_TETOB|eukprot:jgi/Sobl393_1/2626/SZX73058.1